MTTPGDANDVTLKVGAEKNEAQFREVLSSMEHGFEQVTAKIISQLGAEFGKFAQTTGKNIDSVHPKIKKLVTEVAEIGTTGESAFKGLDRQVASLLTVLQQVGRSIAENVGALATVREANRRNSVEITRAAEDAARAQVEDTRAVSRAHSVETQRITTAERSAALERIQISKNEGRLAVVEAQKSAKQRVLATQAAFQTLGRLEKGLGATVAAAARTASSAFSKIFDHFGSGRGGGIAGAVARQNTELRGELGQTESIVSTKTREINNSFTEGTNTALNKRERLIRDSFREQETVVRQSVVRQEAAIAGLRKETQTGVVGAANRGLNIGAFLGGAAIFTAVRSTFSVGSEFVRGLAVLQSSLDLTADQMKGVRQLAIDLGNDITLPGVSALDAAQAIQILTKQFGSLGTGAVDAAEKAAKGTLQLARAAGVGAEDAAGIIGAAVNVFKVGADEAVSVADKVTGALAKAAGVSFTDFRDSFVQGATVFEQFVGPVESANDVLLDFNTTLAILAKNGVTGSTAGAGLKQFFLQANKTAPASAKLSKELAEKVGESGNLFFDASGKARLYDDSLRILRKSLQGLSDQQRTNTLSTLFGSKSITIANALINTSQKDYDDLRNSIQKEGLAAKIAAAQNTGFAGALDALGSVVATAQILLFEKLNPILGKVTLAFTVFFNNILSGNGVWSVVRRGLLGIAAGISAVLAVKGIVEIFQLLSTALTLLLTPMGLFLAAAASIGAVISILTDKSPSFVKTLGALRDTLVDLAKKGLVIVQRGLQDLADVITRDVLPFLEAVGRVVGGKVVDAFKFLSGFVVDTVIPALKTMAEFVERNAKKGWAILVRFFEEKVIPIFKRIVKFVEEAILPKLKKLAGFVAGELVDAFKILVDFLTGSVYPAIFGIGLAFGPTGVAIAGVVSAIIFFWDTIRPIVQPAIDGFEKLGDALKGAFKLNDLSGVGAGFSAAGSGIAKVASTIGHLIVDVLSTAGRAVVSTLKRVFSLANLITAGKGFLDFVEFVGNTLGKIVTNPKFVTAVAAIGVALVAAAGLVAVRFLEGFGKAFLDNLPGLVKLLGIALLAALIAPLALVFKSPTLALTIVAGFLALFTARKLLQGIAGVFEKAGTQAGVGFTKGLFRTVRSSLSKGIGGTAGFTSGLLGKQAAPDGAAKQSAQFFKGEIDKMVLIQRQLRALGSPTVVSLNPTSLKAANDELLKLKANTSEARLKGLLLRDSFSQVGKGLGTALKGVARTAGQGIAGILRGISTGVAAANTTSGSGDTAAKGFIRGFKNSIGTNGRTEIKAGFRQAMDGLRDAAVTGGTSVGKLVGKTIGRALLGAVAAVGAFEAGKAEGAAGGSGLLSALLGGVTAGAVVGGPLGVAMGAVTAAAGLLGGAFGRAEAQAKAFREEVAKLASAFKDDLVSAIEDGTIQLEDFAGNKIDLSTILGLGDNFDQTVNAVNDALSPDQRRSLVDALGPGAARTVTGILKNVNGDVAEFNRQFTGLFLDNTAASAEFTKRFGKDAGVVRAAIAKILAPGGAKHLNLADDTLGLTVAQKAAIKPNQDYVNSIIDASNAVTNEGKAIVQATDDTVTSALAIAKLPSNANLITRTGAASVLAAQNAIETSKELVAAANGNLTDLQRTSVDTARALGGIGIPIDDITEKLEKAHLPPIPEAVVKEWETQLGKVQTAAEKAKEAVDKIPDQIKKIAEAAVADPAQLLQDLAVIQVKADTSGVVDAFANSVNHDFDTPEVRTALKELGVNAAASITEGITSGQIHNKADLLGFMQPLIDAAIGSANTPEQKQKIGEVFSALFAGIADVLPEDAGAVTAERFRKQVADYMVAHPFTPDVTARFVTRLETDQSPLTEGDFRKFGSKIPKGQSILAGLPTAKEVEKLAEPIGKAVPVGLTNGMKNPEAITEMLKQVRNLANRSLAQFKLTLGIKSPSKETHEMGLQLARGLANGIESGGEHAARAAAAAAQASLDAANSVLDTGLNPANIGQLTNPNTPTGGGSSKSALDNLIAIAQSLQTTAAEMNKRGPDVTNVAIHETKDPRSTARATISELRAERLLQHGIR